MSPINTVIDVETQSTHINTFPNNKLVIESNTKNMIVRGVIILVILKFGGAIAAGIIVGVGKSPDPAPAPAPDPVQQGARPSRR